MTLEHLRWLLVGLWGGLAVRCLWLGRSNRLFYVCMVLAAAFCALRGLGTAAELLNSGKDLLRWVGIYEQKVLVKATVALLLVIGAVWLLLRYGQTLWAAPLGLRLCLGAMLAAILGSLMMIASLDNYLPAALSGDWGRRYVELGLCALAWWGAMRFGGENRSNSGLSS